MTRPEPVGQIIALTAKDWRLFWSEPVAAAAWCAAPVALAAAAHALFAQDFYRITLLGLVALGIGRGRQSLRDRRLAVWARLRAAPIPPEVMPVGQAVASAAVALVVALVALAVGRLAFGMRAEVGRFVLAAVALTPGAVLLGGSLGRRGECRP